MLGNFGRLPEEFNLLQDALKLLAILEFTAAAGATGIIVIEEVINFGGIKRRALVPSMAGLCAAFAFGRFVAGCCLPVVLLITFGFGDVAGRRFGRVRRVLLGLGQVGFELRYAFFQLLEFLLEPTTSSTTATSFLRHNNGKVRNFLKSAKAIL